MRQNLERLIASLQESVRAIVWSNYFTTSLKSHLSALQALRTLLHRVSMIEENIECLQTKQEKIAHHLHRTTPARFDQYSENSQNTPEERLIEFLFPWLNEQSAIDIGAHKGNFIRSLETIGFRKVYAFEPHTQLYTFLADVYRNNPTVEVFPLAISNQEGHADLHLARLTTDAAFETDPLLFSSLQVHALPVGLSFYDKIKVQTRSLFSLITEQVLPPTCGLLKIDTEGHDTSVLKGMPDGTPFEIVMHEFWSKDFVFKPSEASLQEEALRIMRARGYFFSITLMRLSTGDLRFSVNSPARASNVWGNVFYFRDKATFEIAYTFIRSTVPQDLS
jgi:FkbM family methyltransferase